MDDIIKTLFGDLTTKGLEDLLQVPSAAESSTPPAPAQAPAINVPMELDKLIGQPTGKAQLKDGTMRVQQARLHDAGRSFHAVISGRSGSGKTTFARILASTLNRNRDAQVGWKRAPLLAVGPEDSIHKVIAQLFASNQYETLVFEDALAEEHKAFIAIVLAHVVHQSKDGTAPRKNVILTIDSNQAFTAADRSVLNHHFLPEITLNNWDPAALEEFILREASARGFHWEDPALKHLRERLTNLIRREDFANTLSARTLWEQILHQNRSRAADLLTTDPNTESKKIIIYSDVTDDPHDRAHQADGAPILGLQQCLAMLDELTGMPGIKQHIKRLVAFIRVSQARGHPQNAQSLHMVFAGNPGTGKTTVARLLADIFMELGLLPGNRLVETERSDLVAAYLGQTAIKTKEKILQALGGILFIDEAYTLHRGTSDDAYGQEAIDTLLKNMEDHRGRLVVIIAGYTKEINNFLNSNPGLKSRLPIYLEFPDFTEDELKHIAQSTAKKQGFLLDGEALEVFAKKIELERSRPNFANARSVRNLLESSVRNQALRILELGELAQLDPAVLNTIKAEDIR